VQSADDVQFGDAEGERFLRIFSHLLDGQLEAVGVAFLAGERTELAAQDAVVRIVDVTVQDIGGVVAHLPLPRLIGQRAESVQILGLEQPQRIRLVEAFAGSGFFAEVTKFAALKKEVHFRCKA
jgi:hypothetical protein